MGGFGSAVAEFMLDHGYAAQIKRLGIPDAVIEHGEQVELHRECGFDPDGIANAVRSLSPNKRRPAATIVEKLGLL
jgi:1-deoxy-D-xylulose-5-phosphate synthase